MSRNYSRSVRMPVAAATAVATARPAAEPQAHGLQCDVPLANEPHHGYYFVKRALDLILGSLLLLAVSPILVLAAIAILFTDGGPILFGQRRMGRGGEHFTCWKLRTMSRDAESRRAEVLHLNSSDGPTFKAANDPRVTAVGQLLRRTSIDELPQFWNVIRGEMSLVGPRPLPIVENRYEGDQSLRLSVKPGLTCTWQVSGRSNITFDQWMEMDLEYVHTRTLGSDLGLIARTVVAVVSGRGAM